MNEAFRRAEVKVGRWVEFRDVGCWLSTAHHLHAASVGRRWRKVRLRLGYIVDWGIGRGREAAGVLVERVLDRLSSICGFLVVLSNGHGRLVRHQGIEVGYAVVGALRRSGGAVERSDAGLPGDHFPSLVQARAV